MQKNTLKLLPEQKEEDIFFIQLQTNGEHASVTLAFGIQLEGFFFCIPTTTTTTAKAVSVKLPSSIASLLG